MTTILVVDDESESRTLLTAILTAEGYGVRLADGGALALASIELSRPELILLDVRMPGLDGFEVCRRLKQRDETRDIPLIFISASGEIEEHVEGFRLGAVDFVTKPFQREELLARLHTHLELSRLRARLEQRVEEQTAQLRQSEERIRNMADSAPVALWVTGPDGLVSFYNKNALTFAGRTMAQLDGGNWIDLVHPDDRASCQSAFSSALTDRCSFRIECRALRADGEYRWVLCNGVPRCSPDGVFAGYFGSSIDITHIKRVHEAAIAGQKLESLGALAGGIAHDFNNVLGGILAEAELLEADRATDSVLYEELQKVKAAAIHGAEIVRELMIYAGQDKADPVEAVDVSRLVEKMLQLLRISVTKHAGVKTELARNLPAVLCSAPQIRQVVMNLVINASEAIGEKEGVITVATRQVSGDSLAPNTATGLHQGQFVCLEVSDSGCGITEEVKAKIFDPFFSTKFAGRGMGLAVVQRIVRDHGGAIDLVSALGQGTTFQVLLPCSAKNASEIPIAIPVRGTESGNFRTQTILVVEDEDLLRVAVSKSLQRLGFRVLVASDGSDAMELMRLHKDDLDAMLLDVTVPGMPSQEVLQDAYRIRPDLRIVVTSAYSKETVDARLSGLRAHHFVRKPFHLDDVLHLLRDTMPQKK